jgi:hypothetical protein
MTLVEALVPLRVTLRARGVTVVLRPGQPTPFDDDEARRLLERLRGKVRAIPAPEATTKAPGPCPGCGGPLSPFAEYDTATATYRRGLACQKCGRETERPPETAPRRFLAEPASGRPVYWEDARGVIREGRAVLLGRDGTTFWVGIETTDGFQWVRDDRLRSRAAFEAQRPLRAVEPIRERRAP